MFYYNYNNYGYSIFTFLLIVVLASYLLTAYPLYQMYKRANLKNPWVAFIPGIGSLKLLNLANLSLWYYLGMILIAMIPIVGAIIVYIFAIYYSYKVFANFGLGVLGCILGLFFGVFVYWYIVITKKPFIAQINPKFTN